MAGPSAGSYLKLSGGFNNKGKQANIGIHQIGEFEGIPTFKAPSHIIPSDEILTVRQNPDCLKKLLNFWEILKDGQSETKTRVNLI